jgi:hypothetical protein
MLEFWRWRIPGCGVEGCGQAIQAVTGNTHTPYLRHACRSECFGEMIDNRSGHDVVSFFKND